MYIYAHNLHELVEPTLEVPRNQFGCKTNETRRIKIDGGYRMKSTKERKKTRSNDNVVCSKGKKKTLRVFSIRIADSCGREILILQLLSKICHEWRQFCARWVISVLVTVIIFRLRFLSSKIWFLHLLIENVIL